MMSLPFIQLKPGKEKSLQRQHPWIFSGAIQEVPPGIQEGDFVWLGTHKSGPMATAYYSKGSIALRVVAFEPISDIEGLLESKLAHALAFRMRHNLPDPGQTNCFRLFFAEGDGVPGLVIDRYHEVAVLQCHSQGLYSYRQFIADWLMQIEGVKAVYNKSAAVLRLPPETDGILAGEAVTSTEVLENGLQFRVNWETGQKTGFFLDQRENRDFVRSISAGKRVLNMFCYTGGFSVYALAGGAEFVASVDSSASAVALADENVRINGFEARHQPLVQDAFAYLGQMPHDFDVVILDPPAFAKNQRAAHNAMMAYKRLNATAMKKMKSGSILLTFSCSQHMAAAQFEDAVRAAAIEARVSMRVIGRLTQPVDHPMNICHPEGNYLKGLVLQMA
jgi:23S rRNA (cytosine1962-C5)-methyltransferase